MPVYEYHAVLQDREKKEQQNENLLNYVKLAFICAFCALLWDIRIIALWWIWFNSGATKLGSVSVVCVHVSVVSILCICVCM